MTSHVARLYVLVVGVLAFFLLWAAVAAHPWAPTPGKDPRIAALAARQHQVQVDSIRVKRLVDARWALYRRELRAHNAAAAQQVAARQVAAQQITAQQAVTQPVAAQQAVTQPVAAAPSVRVVNLPALVVTRTS